MEAQNDFLDNLAAKQHEKLLREIWEDDLTPRKKRIHDGELHERAVIQNLEDEDPYAQVIGKIKEVDVRKSDFMFTNIES